MYKLQVTVYLLRKRRRYSPGGAPASFRNMRLKYISFSYPKRNAISFTVLSVSISMFAAAPIRFCKTYCLGETPNCLENTFEKYVSLRHIMPLSCALVIFSVRCPSMYSSTGKKFAASAEMLSLGKNLENRYLARLTHASVRGESLPLSDFSKFSF